MSIAIKHAAQPLSWWAVAYAQVGLAVHPLKPGTKIPMLPEWQHRATSELADVNQMWKRFPGANIGVHCGKSGLSVIDVDPRNGGVETLARLEADHGPLWDFNCLEARTAGGGRHFVFRSPNGVSLPNSLGTGVDLLHSNHYFVVAPSIGPSGKAYEWLPGQGPLDRGQPEILPAWACAAELRTLRTSATLRDTVKDPLAQTDTRVDDTATERMRLEAALLRVEPGCDRDTYLRIGMALCSTGWSDWSDLWHAWASGGLHSYEEKKFDERHFARDVQSLAVDGGITLGTLYQLAKQNGFDTSRNASQSRKENYGDISNGRQFASKYEGKLLYVHAVKKWLQWDGMRWAWCNAGEALKAAQIVAGEALDRAHAEQRMDPTERSKSNYSQALSVHRNARRLDAMLVVAASEQGMGVGSPAELDGNPWLMGVRNGVLNLKTGTLLNAEPSMHISRQAGAAFQDEAACPQWAAFLQSIFNDDTDVIEFVQRAVGYALTGLVDEEVLFFLLGSGANGKSVFANVLESVFGDYAVTVRATLLAREAKGGTSDAEREKARLPGARLALINEVAQYDVFDDQRLKEIVSRERISARMLYGESFEFMPTHSIWMRGNHQPVAMDAGEGFWRRIALIRFDRHFTASERVPDLDRRILESERDGILGWAVEGCLQWQRQGLCMPAAIRTAGEAYRRDSDQMGEWMELNCKLDPAAEAPVSELYASYRDFLVSSGMRAPSAPVFGRQLAQRGYTSRRTATTRLVRGVALREQAWGN